MVLEQLVNAVSYSMLLFLLAVGLSVTLGLLRVVNLTHGSYYLLGGYVGLSVVRWTHNFLLATGAGAATTAALAALMFWGLLRRFLGQESAQVLITFGSLFIVADGCLAIWGGQTYTIPPPPGLSSSLLLAGAHIPTYLLLLIAVGATGAAAVYWVFERTRVGAMVRAAVDDRELAEACGVDVRALSFGVFTLGGAIAGLAGVLGGPVIGVYPGADLAVLLLALVIVVVGGAGSMLGALLGSLVIGFVTTYGSLYFPEIASGIVYLAMVLVILFRPQGLVPARGLDQT